MGLILIGAPGAPAASIAATPWMSHGKAASAGSKETETTADAGVILVVGIHPSLFLSNLFVSSDMGHF